MEKNILINFNNEPKEYLAVKKSTNIKSIKSFLKKYNYDLIQFNINENSETKVFDTNKHDEITLESVWKIMKNPAIHLSKKLNFTGVKDIDLKILSELENIEDLLNLCSANKYLYSLCNEDFWKKKAIKLGGEETIKYKTKNESWKNHFLKMVMDLENIKESMKREIIKTLTVGREDNEMKAYSEKEIENFLSENNEKVEEASKKMYLDYRKDGELEDLKTGEPDWFREYLLDEEYLPI